MRRSDSRYKRWASIAVLLVATAACSASPVRSGGNLATASAPSPQIVPFVGAWRLVRQEGRNIRTGEIIASATSDTWPGLLMYSTDGWMSVTIDRRPTGSTYWGYFGKFSVAGDTIVHDIMGGVPAGRGPSPALYRFESDGQRLVISTIPGASGTVVHYSFERAP